MRRRFDPSGPLRGTIAAPPDKSLSHRAALLAAMSVDPVRVTGYLDAADTNSTLAAVQALGALVERQPDGLTIRGTGLRAAAPAPGPIDVGNAGTLMRLLPGWLAGQPGGSWTLDGDESIRRRPVDRIAEPLRRMGAEIDARDGRFAPFTVTGSPLRGIEYELPVASAQVKSCVLLAGLARHGRDHGGRARAEPRPHRAAAAALRRPAHARRAGRCACARRTSWSSASCTCPATPRPPRSTSPPPCSCRARGSSSRAWPPTGPASASCASSSAWAPCSSGELEAPHAPLAPDEPVTELDVAHGPLHATTVDADEVPLAIDELPLVALLGCFAEGETVVRGAAELRVKETDRIATVVDGLRGLGADIEATPDGFVVRGTGGLRGGVIDSHGDHRLAMLGAVAGLASREGVEVEGMEAAAVSYPTFEDDLARLHVASL